MQEHTTPMKSLHQRSSELPLGEKRLLRWNGGRLEWGVEATTIRWRILKGQLTD